MKGHELKEWRKANGYKNQTALKEELQLGSRGTVSAWENSDKEIPRIVFLALHALEHCPELKKISGERKSGPSNKYELNRLTIKKY